MTTRKDKKKHIKKLALVTIALLASLAVQPANAMCKHGKASYYGKKFHGKKTASGQVYNMNSLTAAHRSLQFGTELLVKNKHTGRSVVVTVTDRGPFVKGRSLDLSKKAMRDLGGITHGVVPIEYCVVSRAKKRSNRG